MARSLLALLLALLLAGTTIGPAPALAQTVAFSIKLDRPDFATSVVSGVLADVPTGTTSATVTITLSNGSTKTVATSGADGWKFRFSDVYLSGPWLQIAALTSSGAGASLPNNWTTHQAENWVAEHTPELPQYRYPAGFPGIWYGYYGPAYGFTYAYANGLPQVYGPALGYGYGAGYAYPINGAGFGYPWYGGCSFYGYGWFPYR